MKKTLLATILLFTASGATFAAGLTEPDISLSQAKALASAAVAACKADGYHVTVTVVDRAGIIRVVERMDNAGPHTVDASRMKAYTAVSSKNLTSKTMAAAQSNAGAAHLSDVPGFLLLAGGVPVQSMGKIIGAIGVGGAPGGNLDEACALKAIESNKEILK